MSENNRLHIHTRMTPDRPADGEAVVWSSVPHPLGRKRRRFARQKLSPGDRLLRNSALSCALLLAVLAMGNINRPWAKQISGTVEQALTMHIDLDDTIGQLSFVRELMPESALVFLNLTDSALCTPVDGELSHRYTDAQPWLLFDCEIGSEVRAVSDGTVTAVSELSGGLYGVLVDHGDGLESVYAYLAEATCSPGDTVSKGQRIALSDSTVYFEMRNAESTVDPSGQMGL